MAEPITDPVGVGGDAPISGAETSIEPSADHGNFPVEAEPEGGALPLEVLVAEGLKAIQAELAAKLTYDRFKEQQIERLHAELQEYKSDLLRRATEPLFHGLIKLHDHLGQLLGSLSKRSPDELSLAKLLQHLDEFRDDIEMLLGRHGVEPFSVPAEVFDPRRQTAVERLPMEDPLQTGRIAARLRPGFELGEVVLQKERVAVFVTTPTGAPQVSNFPISELQEDESL